MKLSITSSFLIVCCIGYVSSETLQEAIIKDIMPEKSTFCTPTLGSTSSDFTFTSSQEESKWFEGYEESFEKYNAPWSQLEKYVFNAKMMHTDVNSNRTWTIRTGTGGNVYSMVGPMGETVAPQKRIDSPWIDEVWHTVAVEPPQPIEPFMIHGAGSYQSDQTYDSTVGIPLTEIPFYTPSLGKYCNDAEGECGFAAWPQHGPVPVYWESTALNFNRYVDCGDGIIEHTTVTHNNMGSDKTLSRLDAPFGSVRFSTLRDVVISDKNSEILIEPHDLGRFAGGPIPATKVAVSETLGYAIFAEDLPSPLTGPYPLKSGVQFKIHGVGCKNAPEYVSGYPAVMCRLEPTEPDPSSTRIAVTFRATTAPTSKSQTICDDTNSNKCFGIIKFIKYSSSNDFCRKFGNSGGVMCRLDNDFLDNLVKISGTPSKIRFETKSGKSFTASSGITMWSYRKSTVYSMIFHPKKGVDDTLAEIDQTINEDPDAEWEIAVVTPPEGGGDITAKNGVISWVKHIEETGAYWLFFNADAVPGVSDIGKHVAKTFPPGSTLEVLYNTGKAEEENLALAHVYGNKYTDTEGQPTKGLTDGYPILWLGNANEGNKPRDANVYNIVTTANKNGPGGSHYFRQYFVMDRYSDISARAANLVAEVKQQNYNVNIAGDETPVGRTINLYKKGNSVGAAIGDVSCYGNENNPVVEPFVYPTDEKGKIIILQSRGKKVVRNNRLSKRLKICVLKISLKKRLTGEINGGPRSEKLVLNFYTRDGIPTGESFLVDGIRHWYRKAQQMFIYPSAPYNTYDGCKNVASVFEAKFPKHSYINVTYPEDDTYAEDTEMSESSKVCVGSTTPNKDSKALFEVKCGSATYIGSDPYHFAPDGFTKDDNKKRPYICKNDATARGTWTLLGFFPDGDCLSIQEGHTFDEAICASNQNV